MRVIGIIGGMGWESSAAYYRILNEEYARRLGGPQSARLLLNNASYADVVRWHATGDWDAIGAEMVSLARALERGGADCVVIACNTQHEVADRVAAAVAVPLLHIVDPTGAAIAAAGLSRVALLGTSFTMEGTFFSGRLRDRYGVDTLLPDPAERAELHRTIRYEFAVGEFRPETRDWYVDLIGRLVDRGAEGVVLGCTEIPLLVGPADVPGVPLFDTTTLHALAAADFGLGAEASRRS